ncbi:MAG: hypothetical protein WCK51_03795 [Armatimonadota bacterium]
MDNQDSPRDLIPLETATVRRYVVDGEWMYNVDDIIAFFKEDEVFYKNWWRSFSQKRDERGYQDQIKIIKVEAHEERVLNSTGVFRLVQGLKGKKADQVKNWIAQIAVERIQEELDPALAVDRAVKNWYSKGRTDAWIMERLRSLKVRRAFTDEMQLHGAVGREFSILTNIVHQGTFGISVKAHHELKSLDPTKSGLREEMSTTELLLLALGEHTSTVIAKAAPNKGITQATRACVTGGSIAGETRNRIEKEIGASVVTAERASEVFQQALPE